MKVLTVFGTRPEAIKLAPVIRALKANNIDSPVCVTGQHRQMLDQMLSVFNIRAEYDLDVMRENQSPLDTIARILQPLARILGKVGPDWVVVQGDTMTAFAAALSAFHCRVPVAHVEAGLRTGDRLNPFPEEMNRSLVGMLTELHFAPTRGAVDNLLREGISSERIFCTGNTIVDAVEEILRHNVPYSDSRLNDLAGPVLLITAHRRENFGAPLREICESILEIVHIWPNLTIVFPVHKNPAVQKVVTELLGGVPRVLLIEPQPYDQFVHLMRRANVILTDSGGIQEEAPTVGTPVLVMREVTERPEGVVSGWSQLVGTSRSTILSAVGAALEVPREKSLSSVPNPYGDGKAAERIARLLVAYRLGDVVKAEFSR